MKHRIVLWGPPQVGVAALLAVIRHPQLELVGLVVHLPLVKGRIEGASWTGIASSHALASRSTA